MNTQSILVQETQSAKDVDMTCPKMLPFKATTCLQAGPMSLDWLVDPFSKIRFRSSLSPEVPSDEQQRGALPASTRSRWRQDALQAPPQMLQRTTGWDVCSPFLSEGMRCVTWNTRGLRWICFLQTRRTESSNSNISRDSLIANNILCLQEVHGKDEYLQAIQVFAPRIRFFWYTLLPDNENAGGSAILTHSVTCHGRDHFCKEATCATQPCYCYLSILNRDLTL